MKIFISDEEFTARTELNRTRLTDSYYGIDRVFDGDDAAWPGDKEGRALLAFVSHYKINRTKIQCMDAMIDKIPEATGGKMFFGSRTGDVIFEQQLSGHSWYLRGLCEYYEQFGDERVLTYMNKTIENLYIPLKGRIATYPTERIEKNDGGVSGHSAEIMNGWNLSTDIGCAFMSIDGLSHYYKITKNPAVKELLDEMASVFNSIDKCAIKAQTHCTLTAARGYMRMYEETSSAEYLNMAKDIFTLYTNSGMTYTYHNFNWFAKGDTWTEPCAVVDSLMLALMLYKATGDELYRKTAARIYFNAFATMQRPNGGAGTDTTVSDTTHTLAVSDIYEAYFCCSMRLAEGLWYAYENRDILYAETDGELKIDEHGRYFDGDILYGELAPEAEKYAEEPKYADGLKLFPIVKLYKTENEEICRSIRQKNIF